MQSLHTIATDRLRRAKKAADAGERPSLYVNLIAMSCAMAAIKGDPLNEDIVRIARDCGILP